MGGVFYGKEYRGKNPLVEQAGGLVFSLPLQPDSGTLKYSRNGRSNKTIP